MQVLLRIVYGQLLLVVICVFYVVVASVEILYPMILIGQSSREF